MEVLWRKKTIEDKDNIRDLKLLREKDSILLPYFLEHEELMVWTGGYNSMK